ncbi:hypothetical protein ACFOU2_11050 [Bacillus songklensis]|uniref:RCK C-terminal domain-containing protein n=1 Tax=Bacillus songklensis TaxID=1069116 RepID=A0ABV8B417_9BACI
MGLLFISIYLIIVKLVIEISSSLLQVTGLDPKIARYQAISMLTGTGFTTDESKLIINHPVRRKISEVLILFGAFSLAVIISSISNILSDDFNISTLLIISGILGFISLVLRVPSINERLTHRVKRKIKHNFSVSELPIRDVLYFSKNDIVINLIVNEEFEYKDKKLKEMIHPHEDIHVLLINRGEFPIRKNLYETTLQLGDRIVLYGDKDLIKQRFTHFLTERAE